MPVGFLNAQFLKRTMKLLIDITRVESYKIINPLDHLI
jgi:hypothetical protein